MSFYVVSLAANTLASVSCIQASELALYSRRHLRGLRRPSWSRTKVGLTWTLFCVVFGLRHCVLRRAALVVFIFPFHSRWRVLGGGGAKTAYSPPIRHESDDVQVSLLRIPKVAGRWIHSCPQKGASDNASIKRRLGSLDRKSDVFELEYLPFFLRVTQATLVCCSVKPAWQQQQKNKNVLHVFNNFVESNEMSRSN